MRNKTILVVVMVVMATSAQAASFTLSGSQHKNISSGYENARLLDFSTANVYQTGGITYANVYDEATLNVFGGTVSNLILTNNNSTVNISGGNHGIGGSLPSLFYAKDSSTFNISGGSVDGVLYADIRSTINISGGSMDYILFPRDSSTVNITGGEISTLFAEDSSKVYMSGGSVTSQFCAFERSTAIFDGSDFEFAPDAFGNMLSWDVDGQTILGTGILTGKWFDDTGFAIKITRNDTTATIMAIPEPCTLLLLGLGGLALRRKY
jgi:hypothetical protein